jgi:hypothetical protein
VDLKWSCDAKHVFVSDANNSSPSYSRISACSLPLFQLHRLPPTTFTNCKTSCVFDLRLEVLKHSPYGVGLGLGWLDRTTFLRNPCQRYWLHFLSVLHRCATLPPSPRYSNSRQFQQFLTRSQVRRRLAQSYTRTSESLWPLII